MYLITPCRQNGKTVCPKERQELRSFQAPQRPHLKLKLNVNLKYRVFSHDATAAILVSQNNETAAMLVSQTSPVGVELFSYVNALFCSDKFA